MTLRSQPMGMKHLPHAPGTCHALIWGIGEPQIVSVIAAGTSPTYGHCEHTGTVLRLGMILSHDHRFIFLKTVKSAGTSVELALSKICGPLDIITPVLKEEERTLRIGRGPQNYIRNGGPPRRIRGDGFPRPDPRLDFYNHIPATAIREYVGPRIWRDYFKFGFVRNPWDRMVSTFHWYHRDTPDRTTPDFKRFLLSQKWDGVGVTLKIDGAVAVDFVGRYENLHSDFQRILEQLGVGNAVELPNAKGGIRPNSARDYRTYYDEESRDLVAKHAARYIADFGYTF